MRILLVEQVRVAHLAELLSAPGQFAWAEVVGLDQLLLGIVRLAEAIGRRFCLAARVHPPRKKMPLVAGLTALGAKPEFMERGAGSVGRSLDYSPRVFRAGPFNSGQEVLIRVEGPLGQMQSVHVAAAARVLASSSHNPEGALRVRESQVSVALARDRDLELQVVAHPADTIKEQLGVLISVRYYQGVGMRLEDAVGKELGVNKG